MFCKYVLIIFFRKPPMLQLHERICYSWRYVWDKQPLGLSPICFIGAFLLIWDYFFFQLNSKIEENDCKWCPEWISLNWHIVSGVHLTFAADDVTPIFIGWRVMPLTRGLWPLSSTWPWPCMRPPFLALHSTPGRWRLWIGWHQWHRRITCHRRNCITEMWEWKPP